MQFSAAVAESYPPTNTILAVATAEQVPKPRSPTNATVTVFAGSILGATAGSPPPESWAASPANLVAVLHIDLPPGSSVELPPAPGTNRALYFVEGDGRVAAGADELYGRVSCRLLSDVAVTLRSLEPTESSAGRGSLGAELLLLQGRPIGEPVAKHGPFVMNTRAEIQQAFTDYRRTQFGGWPWPVSSPASVSMHECCCRRPCA